MVIILQFLRRFPLWFYRQVLISSNTRSTLHDEFIIETITESIFSVKFVVKRVMFSWLNSNSNWNSVIIILALYIARGIFFQFSATDHEMGIATRRIHRQVCIVFPADDDASNFSNTKGNKGVRQYYSTKTSDMNKRWMHGFMFGCNRHIYWKHCMVLLYFFMFQIWNMLFVFLSHNFLDINVITLMW
jgi:hypothetical protein